MIFKNLNEFDKELKKLCKKYSSLKEDFEDLKRLLEISPKWDILPQNHIVQISWLWEKINGNFYKIRKFLCKSLKSKWKIRIIYRYFDENIEFCEIEFIEIFHKNQKENHDIERIKKYYSK